MDYEKLAGHRLGESSAKIQVRVKKSGRGAAMSGKLKEVLSQYLHQKTHRRPMIIPVVTQV